MGIPAGVRLPKSLLIIVAVYILRSAINAVTKALERWRSSIRYAWQFRPSGLSSLANRTSPASKGGRAAWKTLPSIKFEEFSRKSKRERGDGVVCMVCLGDVAASDEIRELRECLHAFHKECLDGWVDEGRCTCPLCRTELFDRNV